MTSGVAVAIDGEKIPELTRANQIEVLEQMGATTTYRLHFGLDIQEGDIPFLVDGRIDPGQELTIIASVDGQNQCLVKGPVQAHAIHLEHGGAGSSFTVHGGDSCLLMDRETVIAQWLDVTDSDVASSICGNYGFSTDVIATDAGHFENKHTLIQRETDLGFVRRLARRNGYLFWLTCDPEGVETAHFKPPPLDGDPAGELIINLASPNISALDISWQVERPTSVVGAQLDLNSKEQLDGNVPATALTILGDRSLQAITGDTRSTQIAAAVDDAGDLQARGQGALTEANWFIHATCKTSVHALRAIVRAHTLVHVRGAGSRHSGHYFVAAVRHLIDSASHQMEITLLRNAWLG